MTLEEMRQLPPAELRSEAEKIAAKVWKMRFQARGEPIEKPGLLKDLKKERARLLTVLREKELEAERSRVAGDRVAGDRVAGDRVAGDRVVGGPEH